MRPIEEIRPTTTVVGNKCYLVYHDGASRHRLVFAVSDIASVSEPLSTVVKRIMNAYAVYLIWSHDDEITLSTREFYSLALDELRNYSGGKITFLTLATVLYNNKHSKIVQRSYLGVKPKIRSLATGFRYDLSWTDGNVTMDEVIEFTQSTALNASNRTISRALRSYVYYRLMCREFKLTEHSVHEFVRGAVVKIKRIPRARVVGIADHYIKDHSHSTAC